MGLAEWVRPPRRVLTLFGVVTFVPVVVLLWLGTKVIQQDRDLDGSRAQARVDQASARIIDRLTGALRSTAERLPYWIETPPASIATSAVLVEFKSGAVARHLGAPLVFVPAAPNSRDPALTIWQSGESLELKGDLVGAVRVYQGLTGSPDLFIRAGALVRLAGDLRRIDRQAEALAAYRRLEGLGNVSVIGEPADLIARSEQVAILGDFGRREEQTTTAATLAADLQRGRWAIDRGTYEFHLAELRKWTAVPEDVESVSLATAVESVAQGLASSPKGPTAEFRTLWLNGRGMLLISRRTDAGTLALVASPSFIAREWHHHWSSEGVDLALTDSVGRIILGTLPPRQPVVIASGADTGLPWTVRTVASISPVEEAASRFRRWLIGAALAALVLLISVGGSLVVRAVQKELTVARLQGDFVSTVSHEFRTPLTAMTHLTDRLRRDAALPAERRQQYYDALARDTHRLNRFVETLLDMGRMEAGSASLRLETADLSTVVDGIVREFRADAAAGRHPIDLRPNGALPPVKLDAESFGRALWNLLDNAAKYSAPESAIEVELGSTDDHAVVRVRDYGIGVPQKEQQQIFRKFVRGADHATSGVRGTGLGLTMVDQIVRGHGGEVRLDSQIGRGSVFSIFLPVQPSKAVRRSQESRWD